MDASELITRSLRINPPAVERKLVAFIKRRVKEAGAEGVVVGLSGGLDSSVSVILSTKALGKKNVLGVCIPEAGVTDPKDIADAREVGEGLGIDFKVTDITNVLSGVCQNIPDCRGAALLPIANIKARLRMMALYFYANSLKRLVVGSCNRSERRSGYFTKYGDGAADILPLGCLYKTQVKKLAAHLGVPKRIIEKVPSAGLWPGQTDEGELGLPYEKLDMIYAGLDLGLKPSIVAEAAGVKVGDVNGVIERERRMVHKLSMPYIPEP